MFVVLLVLAGVAVATQEGRALVAKGLAAVGLEPPAGWCCADCAAGGTPCGGTVPLTVDDAPPGVAGDRGDPSKGLDADEAAREADTRAAENIRAAADGDPWGVSLVGVETGGNRK